MDPKDVQPHHIHDYMQARGAKVRATTSAALQKIFAKAISAWGVKTIEYNPVREIERFPEKARTRLPSGSEIETLRTASRDLKQNKGRNNIIGPYLTSRLLTGLRQNEILNLRMDQMDDDGILVTDSKNGTQRRIVWTDELVASVEEILTYGKARGGRVYLFTTRRGGKYSRAGFKAIWLRAMERAVEAGMERFTEHDLRATVATSDPANAQMRLGHKRASTTDTYLRKFKVEEVVPLSAARILDKGRNLRQRSSENSRKALFLGGVDGTRTRDPRRDRPVF